jgi:hypothetical protein
MTPKQAAAKLLLHALDQGPCVSTMSRDEMSAVLGERVSEIKHGKIREFAAKIAAPFKERLGRIAGEEDKSGEDAAAAKAEAGKPS